MLNEPVDDGITVAARDEVQQELTLLQTQKQNLQNRLGAADTAVQQLQGSIDRLSTILADVSKWQ